MDAEVFHALLRKDTVRLFDLVAGHAVLGIAGIVHDAVSNGEVAARIEPAAHGFGQAAGDLFQKVDMRQVVQVDENPHPGGQGHVLDRRLVGAEHDFVFLEADRIRHLQLRQARTVGAAALFPENPQQKGIGRGLDGEVFPEALVPGESLAHEARRFADSLFVIQVEGRRIGFGNFSDCFP